ncbi:ERI1 exoribonuclease 2-like [Uranotaenia lowii]|uniref:ERI1 exoribonuclease 2-like n=1 Tax=Uranotaenia lowii TaxID=190385 RepID=UPI0024794B32|nr:ERI1 exoribonuclease 2-like [Uranotaenia lowii]
MNIRSYDVGSRQQNRYWYPQLSSSYKFSQSKLRYLVVIDFEATCWPKVARAMRKNQEIIEFPAVLLNLNTGHLEEKFQQYVKPEENPQLSRYCIDLTGIGQDQVNAGVPLTTCLLLFDKWLNQILPKRGLVLPKSNQKNPAVNVAFATWSDWDLGACLNNECWRKAINKPAYFGQWIDIFYHRQSSFPEALAQRGLQFEGKEHCGLDDAKNLARLIMRMGQDGALPFLG